MRTYLKSTLLFLSINLAYFQLISQWNNLGTPGFSTTQSSYTSLAFAPNGDAFVTFKDNENDNKATAMKFDGISWSIIGEAGFTEGNAIHTNIVVNSQGEPYVGYQDVFNLSNVSVKKFNGSTWEYVGNPGFSGIGGQGAYNLFMAMNQNDEPFVTYSDGSNGSKTSVMKFDGSAWVYVGTPGFSASSSNNTNIAFDNQGTPYVSYTENYTLDGKITVKKFDGSSWVDVGSPQFSSPYSYSPTLAISPEGEPYVAFTDNQNSNKLSVMKYNGSNWTFVGPSIISNGTAQYPSLRFSPSGELIIAFNEANLTYKAVVKKFDGSNWIHLGSSQGITSDAAFFISLCFNPEGIPHIVFADQSHKRRASVLKFSEEEVNIEELTGAKNFNIYPNPASSYIKIDCNTKNTFMITNILGDNVVTEEIEENTYDISKLSSGIYFIEFINEVGKLERRKFVKE